MAFRLYSTLSRTTPCQISRQSMPRLHSITPCPVLHPSPGRSFSMTPAPQTKTIKPLHLPDEIIPKYPYEVSRFFKQSNRGLYGGAQLHYGNVVSDRGNKARRVWRPNVHVKVLELPSLNVRIKTRLTLRVLRTIRREGGLENYLLKKKPTRIRDLGVGGWNLRWLLLQSKSVQKMFNKQRLDLGMPPKPIVDKDKLIHYALDAATPGPLNASNRKTFDELRRNFSSSFVLGNEDLESIPGIEELSDEKEAELLQELEAAEASEAEADEDRNKRHVPKTLWSPRARGTGKVKRKIF